MATWSEFSAAAPELALGIRNLIHQYGPGLAYLATVRADGGPRIHPVSPVITDDGLYCFLIRSPKRADLLRDGRYALHAFPPEDTDDEAYLSGYAVPVTDLQRREVIARAHHATPQVDWLLFEFFIEVAMWGRYAGPGVWPPKYLVWRDPALPHKSAMHTPDLVSAPTLETLSSTVVTAV